MRVLVVVCALLSSIGPLVRAEPLDLRQVSARAKWLAHIDFDAVRDAKVAKKIRDGWLRQDKAKRGLKMMRDLFGFDAPNDLHAITLYGDRLVRGNGVVIVRAKVDRRRLLAFLKKIPDYRTTSHGNHKLHAWTHKKGKKAKHTVTGCFHRPGVMVFGRDAGDVKVALDVLDGKSPSLAGKNSFLAADVPKGAILQARAVGLADAKLPFKSPVVHQSKAISVAIGEYQDEVFARARLVAKSAEVAKDVRAIVDGFLALAKLQHGSDQQAVSVLRATKVTTAGNTVTVEWRGAGEQVFNLLEKAQRRKADWKKELLEKHGKHKHDRHKHGKPQRKD